MVKRSPIYIYICVSNNLNNLSQIEPAFSELNATAKPLIQFIYLANLKSNCIKKCTSTHLDSILAVVNTYSAWNAAKITTMMVRSKVRSWNLPNCPISSTRIVSKSTCCLSARAAIAAQLTPELSHKHWYLLLIMFIIYI